MIFCPSAGAESSPTQGFPQARPTGFEPVTFGFVDRSCGVCRRLRPSLFQGFPGPRFHRRSRLPPNIYRLGGQIGGQNHGTLRSLSVTQFRRQWTAPATADRRALGYGKWQPLEVELQWSAEITGWKA